MFFNVIKLCKFVKSLSGVVVAVTVVEFLWHLFSYTRRRKGWRSSESTRLPPMWPGFKSRRRRYMWVEFVDGSLLCSERFFSGYSGFPSPQKPTFPNFNSTQNQVDKEPLCGCATSTSLFIYLFIYYTQVGCVNKLYDLNAWQPLKATSQGTAVSRFSLVCQLLTTKHELIFKITRTLVVSWQTKSSKRDTHFKVKKNVEP